MKRVLTLATLLCLVASSPAGNVEIKGGEKPVPVNSFATLTVDTADKDQVAWQVYPAPVKLEVSGGKLYLAGVPGTTYTVAVTVVNFDTKRFDQGTGSVAWAGAQPPPPAPDPTPTPSSGLATALKVALTLDDDAALAPKLQAVYAKAVTLVDSAATWGDLFTAMSREAATQGVTGKLAIVQKVIQKELVATLPSTNASTQPIDAAGKAAAKAEFQKIAAALQ